MPARRRDQELLDRIGARVQRLRQERGFTQRALAEAMGVEPETISRAETGSISLSLSNVAVLAARLGVSMADVVGVDPLPAPEQPADVGELLRLYGALDAAGRKALLGSARGIAREWHGG